MCIRDRNEYASQVEELYISLNDIWFMSDQIMYDKLSQGERNHNNISLNDGFKKNCPLNLTLRARFNENKWIYFNFLNWIELNLDMIGQTMENQEGISILGRGKFD